MKVTVIGTGYVGLVSGEVVCLDVEPVLFDGRNMFAPQLPEAAGLEYHAIGRRTNGLNGPHAFDGSNERPGYLCADAAA